MATVQDLISGGSETTPNAIGNSNHFITFKIIITALKKKMLFDPRLNHIYLGFSILYLIHHPEVQQKMQEELDRVCGTALPSLALRAR